MNTKLRHTLVQYQGGGYSGCIWEWNYFYIDHDGEFHNIEATGILGITDAEYANDLLAKNNRHTHTYDVTDPAAIAEFSRESNAVHIKGVLKWMNNNDVPFYTTCANCGNTIEWAEDIALEDSRGCGGIASTADTLLCMDCHHTGVCNCCNKYVGADNLCNLDDGHDTDDESVLEAETELVREGYYYVCDDCVYDRANEIESDKQQDLLSASLATGTPDLFGDAMRWFWD